METFAQAATKARLTPEQLKSCSYVKWTRLDLYKSKPSELVVCFQDESVLKIVVGRR
jgi:hypothetical protein